MITCLRIPGRFQSDESRAEATALPGDGYDADWFQAARSGMAACRLHSLSGQKPEAADYPRHYPLSRAPKDREYVGGLKDWRRIPTRYYRGARHHHVRHLYVATDIFWINQCVLVIIIRLPANERSSPPRGGQQTKRVDVSRWLQLRPQSRRVTR